MILIIFLRHIYIYIYIYIYLVSYCDVISMTINIIFGLPLCLSQVLFNIELKKEGVNLTKPSNNMSGHILP